MDCFLSNAPCYKYHLTEGVAFIKNIPVTVTFGVKYMKINTCRKSYLSKSRKVMTQKRVPLKHFILYWCILHNLLNIISEFYTISKFFQRLFF